MKILLVAGLLIIFGLPTMLALSFFLAQLIYRVQPSPYPRDITKFSEIDRHSYGNWRNKSVEFQNRSEYDNSTGTIHYSAQCLLVKEMGAQFRVRCSKGLVFNIGPEPLKGSPSIRHDEDFCDIHVIAESKSVITIEGPNCNWLTGRYHE